MSCKPPSSCSARCSTNASAACTPASRPSSYRRIAVLQVPRARRGRRLRRPGGGRPALAPRDRCDRSSSSTMSLAIPGFVPPRRSPQNSPLSIFRSVPGPLSSRTSTIGCASTTSASRPAPARTATSSSARSSPARPANRQHRCQKAAVGNQERGWAKTPQAVNDHDFRSQAIGIAIPYGDVTANRGFVVVGTSHDTPDFAADNLLRWWQREGCQR